MDFQPSLIRKHSCYSAIAVVSVVAVTVAMTQSAIAQSAMTRSAMTQLAMTRSAIAQRAPQVTPAPSLPLLLMAQAASLQGSWRLANMTQPPFPTPMLPSADLTADFTGGRVSGSAGCNRYNGSYTTNGRQLKVGPLATTFKACEAGLMQQETMFLQALQGAQRYEVNPDGLQIFYRNEQGTGVLRFTSQTVRGLW
ncbi:MAG: META domain-containing protein [Leptolyngbyaceae cyanobacterium bins.349]|nr:META domain-containing protein [Leptolyngbyaceae cyanobacterium bins.349]